MTPPPTIQKLTPFGDACAGSASALFANALVYPIDVIATRLQIQSRSLSALDPSIKPYHGQLDAFFRIVKEEGVGGLYKGIVAGLSQTVARYSAIRKFYAKRTNNAIPSTATELLLGALAGGISRTFITPISVVTTRQQTTTSSSSNSHSQYFLTILLKIARTEGIHKLWSGLPASLVLTINPAITYGLFERVKGLLLRYKLRLGQKAVLTTIETFWVGAFTKALATVVTYPYIMAKVRLQWKPPAKIATKSPKYRNNGKEQTIVEDFDSVHYKNALDVLIKVLKTEGVVGWYRGMNAQLLKAVLCQGILFVTKDYFTRATLKSFQALEQWRSQ
ncbi:ADP/ATP carrier protein [Blyttiomyces sp. JEL0837]|nr:ADP/ATP carrier protein [Blyttiomyces sp. JEL0837]